MILSIRTDKPEAEIGLFDVSGNKIDYKIWKAHRELSSTILKVITEMLQANSSTLKDLTAVIFYEGPGSFTGLRIGASVSNALEIDCVSETGEDWVKKGIKSLQNGQKEMALPVYDQEAHTTLPKK